MNDQLREELRIRKWIGNILLEEMTLQDNDSAVESLLSERFVAAPEDIWNTFVAPFTDVLKAASLGGKEVLSAAKLSFDVLTSIRPSTIAKAQGRYDARSKKLSAEWSEVMATTDTALEGDGQLIGFLLNPAMFLGAKLGSAAASTPGGVVQYLEDSGWHVPLVGDILGIDKDTAAGSKSAEDAKSAATPLLNKIAGFFFMAHHETPGPLLTEAEEEKEKEGNRPADGDSPEAIMDYLERVGLKDKLEKDSKEILSAKEEQINELMGPFEAQVALLDKIYNSKSLSELASALQAAEAAGVDLDGAGLSNFEQQVNSQVDELLRDEESRKGFVDSYLEKAGQDVKSEADEGSPPTAEAPPEVSDEKLRPEVEKVIYMSATQGMQEQIFTGVQKMKEQMKKEIEDAKPQDNALKMLQSTKLGKKYIAIIDDAVKKIESV